jgi:hypothetical protein
MIVRPSDSGSLLWPQWAYVPGENTGAEADHETRARRRLLATVLPVAFRPSH